MGQIERKMKTTKITLSTVKAFIKKHRENLFINVTSKFDSMTDGVESVKGGFAKVEEDKTESKGITYHEATLGIKGAWFVRGSRDYFTHFENSEFTGIEVYNSCGSFILAIKK